MIGPASSFSTSFIIEIPVSKSPFIKVCSIGAAPLHLGKRETCKLIQPYLGISKTVLEEFFHKPLQL